MADRHDSALPPTPAKGPADDRPELRVIPAAVWPRRLTGFPVVLPVLIGRDRETAALRNLLQQPGQHLVTLTGPGGVGKTRLALAVAAEAAGTLVDEAVVIPLAAIGDTTLVLPTIARALGVRESPERPLAASLANALAGRRLLLVLDNLEHLQEVSTDIAGLIESCPDLMMLATSRAPLRLSTEQRFPSPPLTLPESDDGALEMLNASDAVALFIERARRVRPGFALDAANAAAVAAICRALDGLPLTIELAAAWSHVLSPAALLARLDRRLPLLNGGSGDQPARLRTMRDAIAWSHDLLSDDEKRLFRRLGVFVGGFSLDAAERVWGMPAGDDAGDASGSHGSLETLVSLVDKSLLTHSEADDAEPRFAMLQTVREFALEQLVEHNETAAVAAAHASYFLTFAEQAYGRVHGAEGQYWLDREEEHLPEFRAALTYFAASDNKRMQLRLADRLNFLWIMRGYLREGIHHLEAGLAQSDHLPAESRAGAMTLLALLHWLIGNTDRAIALGEQGFVLAREAGDDLCGAMALGYRANVLGWDRGDWRQAIALMEEAVALLERLPPPVWWMPYARADLGMMLALNGEPERGAASIELSVAQMLAEGRAQGAGNRMAQLGFIAQEANDVRLAARWYVSSLRQLLKIRDSVSIRHAISGLAELATRDQQYLQAAQLLGIGYAVHDRTGAVLQSIWNPIRQRAEDAARTALGTAAFAEAMAAGRALSFDDAVAEAVKFGEALAIDDPAALEATDKSALTRREREVLRALAAGHSDKQIADSLFISRKTASNHVAAILSKLGVETRSAAAARAVRDGLL